MPKKQLRLSGEGLISLIKETPPNEPLKEPMYPIPGIELGRQAAALRHYLKENNHEISPDSPFTVLPMLSRLPGLLAAMNHRRGDLKRNEFHANTKIANFYYELTDELPNISTGHKQPDLLRLVRLFRNEIKLDDKPDPRSIVSIDVRRFNLILLEAMRTNAVKQAILQHREQTGLPIEIQEVDHNLYPQIDLAVQWQTAEGQTPLSVNIITSLTRFPSQVSAKLDPPPLELHRLHVPFNQRLILPQGETLEHATRDVTSRLDAHARRYS